MDEVIRSNRKTFVNNKEKAELADPELPIKQMYRLVGKHLIVIDESIVKRLNFLDSDKNELYFGQEATEDGCIILHPFKLGD